MLLLLSFTLYVTSSYIGFQTPQYAMFNTRHWSTYEGKTLSFLNIFLNNCGVILRCLLGSLSLRSLTIYNLALNGFFAGVLFNFLKRRGFNLSEILALILPHGIFEIPAIIIAGAAGFKIPYEIVRYLAGKKEQPLTKEDIKEYLTLAVISIILIIIAAFVEAYITPKIAEYFLSR